MDQVLLLIIILAVVVLANILARHLTAIPLPFFLIILGLLLAYCQPIQGFIWIHQRLLSQLLHRCYSMKRRIVLGFGLADRLRISCR